MISVPVTLKDGTPARVRQARPGDAAGLVEVNRAILTETDFHIREVSEYHADPETEERFVAGFDTRPGSLYLVAEVGGRLAGVLMFEREKLNRMHHVGMMGMAILKQYHRQGLGTAMLNACLSWARGQQGLEKIRLEVFNTNPVAVRLYEKFGFVHEGNRKRDIRIRGKYVDLMLMAKFLA